MLVSPVPQNVLWRHARSDADLEAIVRMERGLFPPEDQGDVDWYRKATEEGAELWILESCGEIVANVQTSPVGSLPCPDEWERGDVGYLVSVAVHPDWRGMGLGRQAVTWALTREGAPGRWVAKVRRDNSSSVRLLSGFGFRVWTQEGPWDWFRRF